MTVCIQNTSCTWTIHFTLKAVPLFKRVHKRQTRTDLLEPHVYYCTINEILIEIWDITFIRLQNRKWTISASDSIHHYSEHCTQFVWNVRCFPQNICSIALWYKTNPSCHWCSPRSKKYTFISAFWQHSAIGFSHWMRNDFLLFSYHTHFFQHGKLGNKHFRGWINWGRLKLIQGRLEE